LLNNSGIGWCMETLLENTNAQQWFGTTLMQYWYKKREWFWMTLVQKLCKTKQWPPSMTLLQEQCRWCGVKNACG
jgi:hypothetical protein